MGYEERKAVNEDDNDDNGDNESSRRVQDSILSIVSTEDQRHGTSAFLILFHVLLRLLSGVTKESDWWRWPGLKRWRHRCNSSSWDELALTRDQVCSVSASSVLCRL